MIMDVSDRKVEGTAVLHQVPTLGEPINKQHGGISMKVTPRARLDGRDDKQASDRFLQVISPKH